MSELFTAESSSGGISYVAGALPQAIRDGATQLARRFCAAERERDALKLQVTELQLQVADSDWRLQQVEAEFAEARRQINAHDAHCSRANEL